MLIKREVLDRIVTGEIDRAFRRWKRPTVKSGGRLRTAVGELAIEEVVKVSLESLTSEDARRSGYRSLEALRSELLHRTDRNVFKIIVRYAGADPREALREDDTLSDTQCSELLKRINKIGAKHADGLSLKILTWIEAWPERRAQDLSDEIKIGKPRLKAHVRRLKELGLTESMHTGYRLSARGRRLMAYVGKQ
ncbi:MAG: hypothetical protein AAFQ65_13905 [Myxococcota bacterium]